MCQYWPQGSSQPEPLCQSQSIEKPEDQAVLPHYCAGVAITVIVRRRIRHLVQSEARRGEYQRGVNNENNIIQSAAY